MIVCINYKKVTCFKTLVKKLKEKEIWIEDKILKIFKLLNV